MHPIQRLGTPEYVASAALFLASANAAWISGIVLDVATDWSEGSRIIWKGMRQGKAYEDR